MDIKNIFGLKSIENIVNDAVLTVYKEVNEATDKALYVRDISQSIRQKYLQYIEHYAKYATLIGYSTPVEVKEIFVEPQLLEANSSKGSELDALSVTGNRVLITAPPGSGKSTLAKYLLLSAVGSAPNSVSLVNDRLPFLVTVKEIEGEIEQSAEKTKNDVDASFLESIAHSLLKRVGVKYPLEFFRHLLKNGKVFLIVDGLDEATERIRDKLIDSLDHLSALYRNNSILVLSRPKALSDGVRGFDSYRIVPFDQDRWEAFIDKWFPMNSSQATELKSIVGKTPAFQDLCGNPLLTSILCILMERGYPIPQKKSDLYWRCIDALLHEFDRAKRLRRPSEFDYVNEQKRIDILSEVAFRMQLSGKQKARERDIEEYVKDKKYISEIIKSKGLFSLLEALELEHGLLVEVSKGTFAFPHRTFQEFLAAWHIERTRKEKWFVSALKNELNNNLEQWREVAIILAHLLYDATEYINDITNYALGYEFKKSLLEEILIQDVSCDEKTYIYAKERLHIE